MPWLRWESVVMRFLDWNKWIIPFEDAWFRWKNLDKLYKNLKENSWMILVTWPTWSWKTTTLYSMLSYLNNNFRRSCRIWVVLNSTISN